MTKLGKADRSAFKEGVADFKTGAALASNPYNYDKAKVEHDKATMDGWVQWQMGWQTAQKRDFAPAEFGRLIAFPKKVANRLSRARGLVGR